MKPSRVSRKTQPLPGSERHPSRPETSLPAIEVENLTHSYGTRKALDSIQLTISSGEIFGLLGPNGGGKTTLFRILATLLPPTAGTARIFGTDVVREPLSVRRQLGVVFQSSSLDLKLTVAENLTCQGHLYGLAGKALRERSRELLLRLGLEGRTDDRAESLSGGLRRRLEIAKGLLHRPPLLLLDEPSTGLDARARHELRRHLTELRDREEVTIALTTHFIDEGELCDHLAILDCGRLVAAGTPERLKKMIGGDVLVLGASDPGKLSQQIQERFGGEPKVVGGCVRLERPQGHAFIPRLAQAFPGEIDSITVSKPTLEDVFIHLTGHRFEESESTNGGQGASQL